MTLAEDWTVAAVDAGVPEREVLLSPLRATGQHGAMYFPPGVAPSIDDHEFAYSESDRKTLLDRQGEHVLVIDDNVPEPRRLLLLRHEAEHIAQAMQRGATVQFVLRLVDALPNDWLYQAMPHERDADAAATSLRGRRRIEVTPAEVEGDDRMLYCAPWGPPQRDSLPLRLLAFSLFVIDEFDDVCRSGQNWPAVDPDVLAEELVAGAVRLRSDYRRVAAGFLEQLPYPEVNRERWAALPRTKKNAIRDGLRARVLEREEQIVEQLKDALRSSTTD